ncbi:hypothetical protein NCGM2209_2924 [Mycobacterium tuberculosis NCGM2209]|nr:hypothetical protein NCGM2209_2924 [Mycobacterium tuberculosis NCGM2209]
MPAKPNAPEIGGHITTGSAGSAIAAVADQSGGSGVTTVTPESGRWTVLRNACPVSGGPAVPAVADQ